MCATVHSMATKHQCPGGCGLACPNKPQRPAPRVVTTRKQAGEPGMGRWVTVSVLPPCNRGRNARVTSALKRGWGGSQPKGAKRAKRQGAERMGNSPRISRTNPFPI